MKSQLADDPIVAPLMGGFLRNLSQAVKDMHGAYAQHNIAEVKRLAHTVKGSSACYGYPLISVQAGGVEKYCGAPAPDFEELGLLLAEMTKLAGLAVAAQGANASS